MNDWKEFLIKVLVLLFVLLRTLFLLINYLMILLMLKIYLIIRGVLKRALRLYQNLNNWWGRSKMVDIYGSRVDALVKIEVPSEKETIEDDCHIDKLIKQFGHIRVYFRDKEECPFNRGNWIIDFYIDSHDPIPRGALKLPAQMTEEQVERWIKPLRLALLEKDNR